MKRHYYPSEDAGPHVVRDLTKCILCRRCVRACREIKKADILAMGYQGFDSKVVAGRDQPMDAEVCQSCDVCISVCPVGPWRSARMWKESQDAAGCCGGLGCPQILLSFPKNGGSRGLTAVHGNGHG